MATTAAPVAAESLKASIAQARPIPGPKSFNKELELQGNDQYSPAKYPHYLPTWDPNQRDPPLQPFTHIERGLSADPTFPNLLKLGVQIEDLAPSIGSEVSGLQLSALSDGPKKDELALLLAQRKVLVFQKQDFKDLPIQSAISWATYFGRPYVHLTSGSPQKHSEIHLVHHGAGDLSTEKFMSTRNSSVGWHCDSSFEEQLPGFTILYALEVPRCGGDTLFVDCVQAYKNLSDGFRDRLSGLRVVHSGKEQAGMSLGRGGIVRREPVSTEHPLIRTHPATGENSLFVNKSFTRSIVGYKKEESDMLLNFLCEHLALGADFQVRVQWKEGMVVLWDNRLVNHTATMNWNTGERRHLARIALQAERPYEMPFDKRDEKSE